VFADEILKIGGKREDVVAITAAMLHPTGLAPFAKAHPDRVFDVGIAEQHAVTMAAGLAMGGLHPVVALYSTFLNRAFDQMLMDVALHKLPVTFVLDRAGVTGPDGASHNGMWDGSISQMVPGMRVAAPRDATRLSELLTEALDDSTGPTLLRWPKAPAGEEVPGLGKLGGMDVVARPEEGTAADVLLVGAGVMAGVCADAAARLADQGIGALAVDPRWVKPVDPALAVAARDVRLVVTVEDNGISGGFGDAVARDLRDAGVATPVTCFGLPQEFLDHNTRGGILEQAGLTGQHIARSVTEAVSGRRRDSADTVVGSR
jgi:1-deoxy-D-xylulose-5-phosphate synthase